MDRKLFRPSMILGTVFGVGLLLAGRPASADVLVFAASSTTETVNAIGATFQGMGLGKAIPSYASSTVLAKQIEAGAPAAVFISADEPSMDYLATRKLIVADTRKDILGNQLVLVAPLDSKVKVDIKPGFDLAGLLGSGKLAMGDPKTVPAGNYGQLALTKLGVWDKVSGHVAYGDNVRTSLAFVERGEAPLGIAYATDAAASGKVKVVAVFPEDSHPPVTYPIAIVASHDSPEARAYVKFVEGPQAKAIFTKAGFAVK